MSDETPGPGDIPREGSSQEGERPAVERDSLAERRARRSAGESEGDAIRSALTDPILARRAESAEATAHALEDRLTVVQSRLREAEQECATATERLRERELELRHASERLAGGELELRSVSARLADAEQELSAVSKRLREREQELGGVSRRLVDREQALDDVSRRLVDREQQLQGAEREIEARLAVIEGRLDALRGDVVTERKARLDAEAELARLHDAHSDVARMVAELRSLAGRLRGEIEAGASASSAAQAEPGQTSAQAEQTFPQRDQEQTSAQGAPGASSAQADPERSPSPAELPRAPMPADAQTDEQAALQSADVEPVNPTPTGVDLQSSTSAPTPAVGIDQAQEQAAKAAMADALAAAVARLRARVAAVAEDSEGSAESERPSESERPAESAGLAGSESFMASEDSVESERPAEREGLAESEDLVGSEGLAESESSVVSEGPPESERAALAQPILYLPALATAAPRRPLWIAEAINSIATHRAQRLAAELVLELLAARAASVQRPLRFGLRIAELGGFELHTDGAGVSVLRDEAPSWRRGRGKSLQFVVEGSAVAFAELAGGGGGGLALRGAKGPRVRGRKRQWKLFKAACRPPLALSDVVDSGRSVWPGLLLLALCELVDPAWLQGEELTVDFAIDARRPVLLRAHADAGGPLSVSRVPASELHGDGEMDSGESSGLEGDDEQTVAASTAEPRKAQASVRVSERAFNCMIAGRPLEAGEQVRLLGEAAALQRLLQLTDRVQGIRRIDA